MKRFNYTRFRRGKEMAEGIAVHAESRANADIKAAAMLKQHYPSGDSIVFQDNRRCVSDCGLCRSKP